MTFDLTAARANANHLAKQVLDSPPQPGATELAQTVVAIAQHEGARWTVLVYHEGTGKVVDHTVIAANDLAACIQVAQGYGRGADVTILTAIVGTPVHWTPCDDGTGASAADLLGI